MTAITPDLRPRLEDAVRPGAPSSVAAIRRALRLCSAEERRRLGLAAGLAALANVAGVALLALSGYLIARAAEQPPVLSLTVAIVSVRGFGIARAAARYAERLIGHDVVLGALARLRTTTYAAVAPTLPGPRATTDLLDGIVADVDQTQDAFLRSLAPLAAGAGVTIIATAAAAAVLPVAGAVVLGLALLQAVGLPYLAHAAGRRTVELVPAARARLVRDLTATLDAAPELVLSDDADGHAAAVARSGQQLAALELRESTATAVSTAASGALAGLGVVAVVAVALAARATGELGPTMVGFLALLALGTGEALEGMTAAARELHRSADAVQRVEALTGPTDGGPVGARRDAATDGAGIRAAAPTTGSVPADGSVVLHDVEVRRSGRAVLSGLELQVAAGERVALVGPSGAGKSTIVDLLAGFLPPSEWNGTASVGGADLRRADGDALRRRVLHLPQDPYLFDATLRANLLLARPEATDADLVAALVAAGAGPWLATLADGLDTPLGERGAQCSGGERQRVGLARGIVAPSVSLMLLDEPASHLPARAANDALAAVLATHRSAAALIVTHRSTEAALASRTVSLPANDPVRPSVACVSTRDTPRAPSTV